MINNGRVHIPSIDINTQFKMYDKIEKKNTSFRDALIGNWIDTPLSCAFFSSENISRLNNDIIKGVYQESLGLYTIGPQDTDQLKIIMRAIYLESSNNLPNNISEQVNALNKLVLNYSIPQVLNSIKSYKKYIRDISEMYTPMDAPILSNTNNKTLELKPWF